MADVKLILQNYGNANPDDEQEFDDYNKYYQTSMLDQSNPDDLLSPLEKLHKYCSSENIFTRQMVARSVIETVQSISTEPDCLSLLNIITKLSEDNEPSVRCELIEQLPPCCMLMNDLKLIPEAVANYILPVMAKYLTDPNNQVRKLSQSALLQLIDQELLFNHDVEMQICPVIIHLTEPESSDDFRTEAVTLMTKVAPFIGGDLTKQIFLDRFGNLCSDPLFHVRKVCASNFGDVAYVVKDQGTTENVMLPLFARLCEDGVWGVRKACAETFMSVSASCSIKVKYDTLSPLFVGLLCDKSRWVQMAAYQALGEFITTFTDFKQSAFRFTKDGKMYKRKTSRCDSPSMLNDEPQEASPEERPDPIPEPESKPTPQPKTIDESPTYNNFEFWRTPIADIQLNEEDSEASSESIKTYVIVEPEADGKQRDFNDFKLEEKINSMMTLFEPGEEDNECKINQMKKVDVEILKSQSIVPSALLEHFVSMTDPTKAQTIDGDLAIHCAFTLPGVALALGYENWPCLKDIYSHLASDMQWKVRRTLAFSIHDFAMVLGQKITIDDLVPVFNGFLKDLDEVRIGVLKHLYSFISVLPHDLQKEYLHVFGEFLNTDNTRNWRFRLDLVHQLMSLSNLYIEEELAEFICPVALSLAVDKVAEVRHNAYKLLCMLLRRLSTMDESILLEKFVASIASMATPHQHWVKRKSCAQIYLSFLQGHWYDLARFSTDLLPSLLDLCTDVVPNVRLVASKALVLFMNGEYVQSLPEANEVRKSVEKVVETLQKDGDRDVRYFSGGEMEQRLNRSMRIEDNNEYGINDDFVEEVYIEEGNEFIDDHHPPCVEMEEDGVH